MSVAVHGYIPKRLKTMEPLAHYWISAAETGFVNSSDWIRWADRHIEQMNNSLFWLTEMSVATSVGELRNALESRIPLELAIVPTEYRDAVLGYIYLRYLKGELGLATMLNEAGQWADSGSLGIECEQIYALLNELERSGSVVLRHEAAVKSKLLFRPYVEMVKHQQRVIENAQLI
ncbi:MAG TPA: hypothetical protein VMF06_12770 [Candidatus Limnocylindria bacterium]|jgi:hypothetical protein|nr:hypothetical protein [Candidatus Limnocylindria bacterium]